eukprot:g803.t1
MYDGPIREGSRGGRDQFSWESVKGDKDREFYLGHSVKALVGHWQKNKDPYWYAKHKSKSEAKLAEEIKAVKQKEEELMLEALGIKKASNKKQTADFGNKLQKYEVDELLKRRERDDGEQPETDELGPRTLGFRRTAAPLVAGETHEVLEGIGLSNEAPTNHPLKRHDAPPEKSKKKKRKKKTKDDDDGYKRSSRKRREKSPKRRRGNH